MTTPWLLLGVMVIEDLELEQLDVKTTFLHVDLEEDINMSQNGRLHGDRRGISPRMSTKEKPLRLKTSVENVVPKV